MTIIDRSAAVHWWGADKVPAEASHFFREYNGSPLKMVTWGEVMDRRREKQARRLEYKRTAFVEQRRAIRIHVRYFDQDLLGGWHCYVDGIGFSHWVRRGSGQDEMMQAVPLAPSWEKWCEAFARKFRRGTFCRRPRGVMICWALCRGTDVESIEWPETK